MRRFAARGNWRSVLVSPPMRGTSGHKSDTVPAPTVLASSPFASPQARLDNISIARAHRKILPFMGHLNSVKDALHVAPIFTLSLAVSASCVKFDQARRQTHHC